MNHNPISDVIQFLLQPAWTSAIFWLLLLGSIAVAVHVYRTMPAQHTIEHVGTLPTFALASQAERDIQTSEWRP